MVKKRWASGFSVKQVGNCTAETQRRSGISEARNPKFETNSNGPNLKFPNKSDSGGGFEFSPSFGLFGCLVSDFDIRFSDFLSRYVCGEILFHRKLGMTKNEEDSGGVHGG
jgi:hypothetical protein